MSWGTARNRGAQDQVDYLRISIIEKFRLTSQVEPRLTAKVIAKTFGISNVSARRHLAWLRKNGYLPPTR